MSLFDLFKPKGDTEKTLKDKGVTPFQRSPAQLGGAVTAVRRAQEMGDEWDVVDDPRAEAEAKALAAQAEQKARAEAARQEVERQRRIQEMMAAMQKERDRIARQERVDRLVVTAASTLRSRALASSARWEGFVRENSQAHQSLDRIYLQACCWRCGQKGRLPIEDAALFGPPAPPARPGGAQDEEVMRASRELLHARKTALEAWRRYNDRRLETERLRLDANFHPRLVDRFTIERDCEVCGSQGMFHAEYLAGNYGSGGAGYSLPVRWSAAMSGHSVYLSPFVGFNKWVPVSKLDREQAKAWLRAPRQGAGSNDDWRKYEADRKEWDEKVAKGKITEVDFRSPANLGRGYLGTHREKVLDGSEVKIKWVTEPTRPLGRTGGRTLMEWPDEAYWTEAHPKHWKGGPGQDLHIKPGVVYPPDKQDPLSKEPRLKPPLLPASNLPPLAQLQARQSFWASAL